MISLAVRNIDLCHPDGPR